MSAFLCTQKTVRMFSKRLWIKKIDEVSRQIGYNRKTSCTEKKEGLDYKNWSSSEET